jgi:hypothetical protein
MSPEYNGQYKFFDLKGFSVQGFLEGNRPVYEKNGKCVWWHRQYRHWWVGPCENVGLNAGYAYAENDIECPFGSLWRRGGSDEILHNVQIEVMVIASSGGDIPNRSSGTAGVNAVIRNGRYKQTCRPVYRNGRFRCP